MESEVKIMFNKDNKLEFINQEPEGSRPKYAAIFSSTEDLEKRLGKDLYDFNVREILNHYRSRSYSSYISLYIRNRMLVNYADWAIAMGLVADGTNHYQEIADEQILRSCLNQKLAESYFVTKEELMEDLNEDILPNPSDRFLVLGIFEGIGSVDRMEFQYLTMDNISGNIITLPTRKLEISNELVKFAEESAECYDVYTVIQNDLGEFVFDTQPNDTYRYRSEDNRIIKARHNAQMDAGRATYNKRIDSMLDRIVKVLNKNVYSYVHLKLSGKIDYIKELKKNDSERCKTLKDVIRLHNDEIVSRYGQVGYSYLISLKGVFED